MYILFTLPSPLPPFLKPIRDSDQKYRLTTKKAKATNCNQILVFRLSEKRKKGKKPSENISSLKRRCVLNGRTLTKTRLNNTYRQTEANYTNKIKKEVSRAGYWSG